MITLKLLIDRGANVTRTRQSDKMSALHIAVFNGYTSVVAILLRHGADANAKTRYIGDRKEEQLYLTPLLMATQRPVNSAEDISRLLLAYGADVNATFRVIKWTPLHFATNYGFKDMVELLLDRGADVNARDDRNRTALQFASFRNNTNSTAIVKLLLDRGADVNAVAINNSTALDFALMGQNLQSMRLLIDRRANISLARCMFISLINY